MGVIAWIVVGLLAGWIAAKLTNAPHGMFRNIIVGLIGALVGGYLFESSTWSWCRISGAV